MNLHLLEKCEVLKIIKTRVSETDNRDFRLEWDEYSGDLFVQRWQARKDERPAVKQDVRITREFLEDNSLDDVAEKISQYLNVMQKAEKRWRERYDKTE